MLNKYKKLLYKMYNKYKLIFIIIILVIIIGLWYFTYNISEYFRNDVINIYDENNKLVYTNKFEIDEQKIAKEYIKENDTVLELGARYGSVSVIINKKLKNKKNHIAVDPDETIWNALEKNKKINNCEFKIIKGFISNKKLGLESNGYGTTFNDNKNSKIKSYTLNDIKKKYNINKFTVLVADCEGFLEIFLDENPSILDEIRLIIFEEDRPDKCNYDKIKNTLKNKNFKEVLGGFQNVWSK
jgi:FkbM family methyltransferase